MTEVLQGHGLTLKATRCGVRIPQGTLPSRSAAALSHGRTAEATWQQVNIS